MGKVEKKNINKLKKYLGKAKKLNVYLKQHSGPDKGVRDKS